MQDSTKFYNYAKEILGKSFIFKKVERQSKDFLKEGKTYEGMIQALKYFYEIKKNDINRANGGVGIIPYVYDEAIEYFQEKEKIANKIIKKDTSEPNIKKVNIKRHGFQKMTNVNYFHLE